MERKLTLEEKVKRLVDAIEELEFFSISDLVRRSGFGKRMVKNLLFAFLEKDRRQIYVFRPPTLRRYYRASSLELLDTSFSVCLNH